MAKANADGLRREFAQYAARTFDMAVRDFGDGLDSVVPVVTGKTKRSKHVTVRRVGNTFRAQIEYPTKGAFYTDEGRPKIIRPKRRGGVLRFYWPKVGRVVYFKRVRWKTDHPKWFRKQFRDNLWAVVLGRAASRARR